jgi:hypothetical protein
MNVLYTTHGYQYDLFFFAETDFNFRLRLRGTDILRRAVRQQKNN